MAQAYARILGAIQTFADAASDLLKWVLGTPGDTLLYPAAGETGAKVRDTGNLWSTAIITTIMEYIGVDFDRNSSVWADISTNGIGIAATIEETTGVTAVTKNEALDTLKVDLDPAYLNAHYFVTANIEQLDAFPVIVGRGADTFTIQFIDRTGAAVDINARIVMIHCCGQM